MNQAKLSELLSGELVSQLKLEIEKNTFRGVTFQRAMQFLLTDGLLPSSGLPANSFLQLEDWVRRESEGAQVSYTATDLKNKTGEILDLVLRGRLVRLTKHGRVIAEIRPAS